MIKRLILLFSALLMLVSCATTDMFTETSPYIEKLGKEGEWVFTTVQNITGINAVEINRISGAYNPETGNIYGVIEGNFSKIAFNAAMRISKETERIKSPGLTFWKEKNSGLLLYCPAKGVVLFAQEDIHSVIETAYGTSCGFINSQTVTQMLNAQAGLFINKPKALPQIGIDIPDKMIEDFEVLTLFVNEGILDAEIQLDTESKAKTFFTMLKAGFVTKSILSGQKADYKRLSEIFVLEKNTVYLKGLEVPEETINNIVGTII